MCNEIDFLDWASKNGYSTTEVPMNIMEMILDFEKHVESKVKNLTIPRVVGRSEQLSCEHRWQEYEGESCRMGWKCSKCKEVKYFAT